MQSSRNVACYACTCAWLQEVVRRQRLLLLLSLPVDRKSAVTRLTRQVYDVLLQLLVVAVSAVATQGSGRRRGRQGRRDGGRRFGLVEAVGEGVVVSVVIDLLTLTRGRGRGAAPASQAIQVQGRGARVSSRVTRGSGRRWRWGHEGDAVASRLSTASQGDREMGDQSTDHVSKQSNLLQGCSARLCSIFCPSGVRRKGIGCRIPGSSSIDDSLKSKFAG